MAFFLLLIAGTSIGIFWGGYVASTLWAWFLVPLGVKAITYWHAAGISALLGVFLGSRGLRENKKESLTDSAWFGLFSGLIIPLLCLGIGWIAKLNMQ